MSTSIWLKQQLSVHIITFPFQQQLLPANTKNAGVLSPPIHRQTWLKQLILQKLLKSTDRQNGHVKHISQETKLKIRLLINLTFPISKLSCNFLRRAIFSFYKLSIATVFEGDFVCFSIMVIQLSVFHFFSCSYRFNFLLHFSFF